MQMRAGGPAGHAGAQVAVRVGDAEAHLAVDLVTAALGEGLDLGDLAGNAGSPVDCGPEDVEGEHDDLITNLLRHHEGPPVPMSASNRCPVCSH